jgi:RIO-like serine/threonine protein kinase
MCSLADLIKIEKIGSGKSADIYKVHDPYTHQIQALKVFKNLDEY